MDTAILVAIAVAITAVLVAREIKRNRRARSALIGDGYQVEMRPPWPRGGDKTTAERQGVWSAWYREGTLGAYVCTHVEVRRESRGEQVPIAGARLEIVDEPDGRREVLTAEQLPGADAEVPALALDIDTSINAPADEPGKTATLVLRLDLEGTQIERRLCPVEHRFVAAGATPRTRP